MSIRKWKNLVFFYNLDFQIVKADGFNKVVTRKASFAETLELRNVFVQPDWFGQIELVTDFLQRLKYFVSASVITGICNAGVLKHVIVFKYLSP